MTIDFLEKRIYHRERRKFYRSVNYYMYSITDHNFKRQGSKKKILKTALSLFSEFGFLGVSMREIAREAGLTKPALYYYFRSKKELYHQVLEYSFGEIFDVMRIELVRFSSGKRRILCLIRLYLHFNLNRRNLFYLSPSTKIDAEVSFQANRSVRKMRKRFWSLLKKSLIAERSYSSEDLKMIYIVLFGLMNATVLENFSHDRDLDLHRESRKILQKAYSILKLKVESNYKSIT